MKHILAAVLTAFLTLTMAGGPKAAAVPLILCYSENGRSALTARMIAEATGGRIWLIPETEKDSGNSPIPLSPESFDVIFLGFPAGDPPLPEEMCGYLRSHDFSGKRLLPFGTTFGQNLTQSIQEIAALCPDAAVLPGYSAQKIPDLVRSEIIAWAEASL